VLEVVVLVIDVCGGVLTGFLLEIFSQNLYELEFFFSVCLFLLFLYKFFRHFLAKVIIKF